MGSMELTISMAMTFLPFAFWTKSSVQHPVVPQPPSNTLGHKCSSGAFQEPREEVGGHVPARSMPYSRIGSYQRAS